MTTTSNLKRNTINNLDDEKKRKKKAKGKKILDILNFLPYIINNVPLIKYKKTILAILALITGLVAGYFGLDFIQ